MPSSTLDSEIVIERPPEIVKAVFMDWSRYPLWNPLSLHQSRRQQTMYELHSTTANQQLKRVSMGWHCPWQMSDSANPSKLVSVVD